MNFGKTTCLFAIGGGCYVALELLFRGRSHYTMFILAGLCFLLIGHLGRLNPRPSLPVQMILGSMICTAGELIFGLIFNQNYTIWDYRHQPGNFLGQICPMFTLIWVPLSFLAALVFDWCDELLSRPCKKTSPKEQLS